MALHRYLIELDPKATHKNYHYSPQIQQVIKSTLDHQIKRHSHASYSPQQALLARTKKLIHYEPTSMSRTTDRWNVSSSQEKRGLTARLKSKRGNKLNETKRQLELLNEFYKSSNKTPLKRYQEQIEQQQAEIHTVVAQYRLKRKWNSKDKEQPRRMRQSAPYSTINPEDKIQNEKEDLSEPKFQRSKKSDLEEIDIDAIFDRVHPYKRLLFSRRKSKGKVEPWGATLNF